MAGTIGKEITFEKLVEQWNSAPVRFEINALNFNTNIGKDAVEIFKKSFELRTFNSSGSFPWSPRKDKKPHQLLEETGSLKNSIVYSNLSDHGTGVKIYTDPRAFGGSNRNKAGICYAAIHNDPDGSYTFNNGGKSVRRQFMGHSSILKEKIETLTRTILFQGMP